MYALDARLDTGKSSFLTYFGGWVMFPRQGGTGFEPGGRPAIHPN
jgi:hypothetical protein